MLDALRVQLRGSLGNAERLQKSDDGLMPLLALRRQLAACVGQENGAVRAGAYITGLSQPGESPIDGHVRDPEFSCQVRDARFANGCRQISDGLDVVLRHFCGPITPGTAEAFGWSRRAPPSGGARRGGRSMTGTRHVGESKTQPVFEVEAL